VIGEDPVSDAERFYRTDDGVVLVTPEALQQKT
jgi:glucose-1-phosphate adenylyltransferase